MNARLHVIGPIGFDLSDSAVRRAGLDHWDKLQLSVYKNPDEFQKWLGERSPWLVTKFGSSRYDKPAFNDEDILVFGSELHGLPENWIEKWPERTLYIPLLGDIRSYNLSNAVSIILAQASLKAGLFEK